MMQNPLFPVADAHTHELKHDALVSREPWQDMPRGYLYSVGIHPWHLERVTPGDWSRVCELAVRADVLAVGETGLDVVCGVPFDLQVDAFEKHIRLSEEAKKPLVVHDVRAHQQLIDLHRKHRPAMPWVIHGFRGKPQLALMLLRQGFYLSLGEHFNPESAAVIPPGRLLVETDDSAMPIGEIASRVAQFNKYFGGNPAYKALSSAKKR